MIFWVPTPFAMPAQRRSTSLMILQRSAHAWLMMVIWAPKTQEIVSRQKDIKGVLKMTKVSLGAFYPSRQKPSQGAR